METHWIGYWKTVTDDSITWIKYEKWWLYYVIFFFPSFLSTYTSNRNIIYLYSGWRKRYVHFYTTYSTHVNTCWMVYFQRWRTSSLSPPPSQSSSSLISLGPSIHLLKIITKIHLNSQRRCVCAQLTSSSLIQLKFTIGKIGKTLADSC